MELDGGLHLPVHLFVTFKINLVVRFLSSVSAFDSYVQHHQAAELAEGVIWDVADVVEGERHGLQGGQLTQSLHRHLLQRVIVQPQVTE